MSTRASRSHDGNKRKRARFASPNKSRSRSRRRKRHKSNGHKSGRNKHDRMNNSNNLNNNNLNNNNNGDTNTESMISGYNPSSEMRSELEELLRFDHNNYMNKKKEAHNKISTILNSMTSKQEQRYECWNRSVIPKNIVKSIMNNVLNKNMSNTSKKKSNIDDKSIIVIQALSKCLVMDLVSKSREIQKKTISNYIKQKKQQKQKQQKEEKNNNDELKQNQKILYPPLIIDDDDKNEENKNDDNNNNHNDNDNDNDDDDDEDKLNDIKNEENEIEIERELNEEFVVGAIRPIHIREALRKLQHDRSSFFHSKQQMFGTYQ